MKISRGVALVLVLPSSHALLEGAGRESVERFIKWADEKWEEIKPLVALVNQTGTEGKQVFLEQYEDFMYKKDEGIKMMKAVKEDCKECMSPLQELAVKLKHPGTVRMLTSVFFFHSLLYRIDQGNLGYGELEMIGHFLFDDYNKQYPNCQPFTPWLALKKLHWTSQAITGFAVSCLAGTAGAMVPHPAIAAPAATVAAWTCPIGSQPFLLAKVFLDVSYEFHEWGSRCDSMEARWKKEAEEVKEMETEKANRGKEIEALQTIASSFKEKAERQNKELGEVERWCQSSESGKIKPPFCAHYV